MQRSEAGQIIRERAARSEQIVLVPHAMVRMRERSIDFLDVQRCLRHGKAIRGPYVPSDSITDEPRYDVEAIVDGDWLRVVVELPDERSDIVVVTVIVLQ